MNRKMKSNPQVRTMSRGTKIFTYICLAWAVLVALLPLVWLFISSLEKKSLWQDPGFQLPDSICLDGYISTFRDLHVMRYFGNSMIIAGVSVVISILMISMSAYCKWQELEFKGKKLVNLMLYSTMFIPATALTYPVYNLVNKMHIYNTRGALIFIYACSGWQSAFCQSKLLCKHSPMSLRRQPGSTAAAMP